MAPIPRKPALKKGHVIRPTRNHLPSRPIPISRRRLDLWSPMLCHPSPGIAPRWTGILTSAADRNPRHDNNEVQAEKFVGVAEEENKVAPKSPSPCRLHQNGMGSTQHCKSQLVMRPKMSEFKALHQSRAARKGVQDATLEKHRHTSGNPSTSRPPRERGVLFGFPSSRCFSIRQAASRYLGSEQTGAKQHSLGDGHLDGLQPSPPLTQRRTTRQAMPSAFHDFLDEIRSRLDLAPRIEIGPFPAIAAFPGRCPTPWVLAATHCGGQTRLPERARRPPSVSNPRSQGLLPVVGAEKGKRERNVSNSLAMQAQTSAHETTPSRPTARPIGRPLSANENMDVDTSQHFNTACCSLGCLLPQATLHLGLKEIFSCHGMLKARLSELSVPAPFLRS